MGLGLATSCILGRWLLKIDPQEIKAKEHCLLDQGDWGHRKRTLQGVKAWRRLCWGTARQYQWGAEGKALGGKAKRWVCWLGLRWSWEEPREGTYPISPCRDSRGKLLFVCLFVFSVPLWLGQWLGRTVVCSDLLWNGLCGGKVENKLQGKIVWRETHQKGAPWVQEGSLLQSSGAEGGEHWRSVWRWSQLHLRYVVGLWRINIRLAPGKMWLPSSTWKCV